MIYEHNNACYFEMHRCVCEFAEQSWVFAGSYECNAGFVCELAEQSWVLSLKVLSAIGTLISSSPRVGFLQAVMNAMLGWVCV